MNAGNCLRSRRHIIKLLPWTAPGGPTCARRPKTLLLLLLSPALAWAQSREETFAYIDREIARLPETRTYFVRELSLSADAHLHLPKRVTLSRRPDKGLVIPLKDVDIFVRTPATTRRATTPTT